MDSSNTTRKTSWSTEVIKIAISICILGAGIGGTMIMIYNKKKPGKIASDALIPMVSTFPAISYDGPLDLVVSGSVVPFREIKVAAEVSGRIVRKYEACHAGHYVTKGTLLLEIDPTDYQLEVETTKSEIVQSEKSLDETNEEVRGAIKNLEHAQSDLQLQEKNHNRIKMIGRSLSEAEVDQAERALLQSQTALTGRRNTLEMLKAKTARLKAALKVAGMRFDKAQLNLDRTSIIALDDGVIVRESVEQGDYVQRGTQLFLLEDTSRSEVRCNLTSTELAWIRTNSDSDEPFAQVNNLAVYRLPRTAVKIYEKEAPKDQWSGTLERFDGIGRDELTKTIPCRIVVNSPILQTEHGPHALVRGMYVKCRITIPRSQISIEKLIAFPTSALRPGNYIWVARDKKLKKISVKIADRTTIPIDGEQVDVAVVDPESTGLEVNDLVIVSPIPHPIDGGQVLLHTTSDAENDSTDVPRTASEKINTDKSTETNAALNHDSGDNS